ncbi:Lsr2 family protein [Amycolatopsis sp. NBC_00345]|uniref:histone-like nucleoid-structuring protein Lsr2 n=1 Tax=Amycolatopsis sp. NBC_00345 TaxID=2975955 RepID=UPI002E274AE7
MAQKVRVDLVDDIDGSDAAQTVPFALDGVTYEIDLSDGNAARLRDGLAPFIAAARRTGGRKTHSMTPNASGTKVATDREHTRAVRRARIATRFRGHARFPAEPQRWPSAASEDRNKAEAR